MSAATLESNPPRVLVWDLPTRLFHWLLVASFATAYATSEWDGARALHALAGYTAGGLIAFRLLWGVAGTRYARFTGFAFAPARVFAYLRSLLAGRPQHYTGHNPAGSWAVLALLGLVAATAATGFATLNGIGPEWLEDVHEGFANATLALVGVHVIAVIASSLLHRENLARAMLTGRKQAHGEPAAAGSRWPVAAVLGAAVVALWIGLIPVPGLQRPGVGALPTLTDEAAARIDDEQRDDGRGARRDERGRDRRERDREH